MTIKCLITAGCSNSQVPNADVTWPVHLNEALKPDQVYYLGQGAAGNGIISRKVIYALTEALKTYRPEEILVGIMWSGSDRREVYSFNDKPTEKISNDIVSYRNPCAVIHENNHYILNKHWTHNEYAKTYHSIISDEDSVLVTLEHMLRVQWLLKLNNIKYFMTEYDYDVFAPYAIGIVDKLQIINSGEDLKFLYDQIDFEFWLPIDNMYSYAKFDSKFDFARPPDPHPSTEQHKEMVEKVLLPFLKNKYNID